MDEFRIHTRIIDPIGEDERAMLAAFLSPLGLDFEDDAELSVLVEDGQKPIATASLAGDVIKCVGVLPDREGEGAAAKAVSAVLAEAEARGRRDIFVYTRPHNRAVFESLGFATLAVTAGSGAEEGVMLMENDADAFDRWSKGIESRLPG